MSSKSEPPSTLQTFATASAHPSPPLQPPASTVPSPLLTHYLPLAGLITSPILLLLPPRKVDLYTLSLFGVFGLSAEEYWYGKLARRQSRYALRDDQSGIGRSDKRISGELEASRTGKVVDKAKDMAAEVQQRARTEEGIWASWGKRQPPSDFKAGRLDEVAGSVPVRGFWGLGHDGRRGLLQQQHIQPKPSQQAHEEPSSAEARSPLFQLPSSRETSLLTAPIEKQPSGSSTPIPPSDLAASSAPSLPTGQPSPPDPASTLTQPDAAAPPPSPPSHTSSPPPSSNKADRSGLTGMLKNLYYGSSSRDEWQARRASEDRERIERGEGVWEAIAQDVGEAFGGGKKEDEGE